MTGNKLVDHTFGIPAEAASGGQPSRRGRSPELVNTSCRTGLPIPPSGPVGSPSSPPAPSGGEGVAPWEGPAARDAREALEEWDRSRPCPTCGLRAEFADGMPGCWSCDSVRDEHCPECHGRGYSVQAHPGDPDDVMDVPCPACSELL